MTKTLHMGTHLRVLTESYLMNTNMTGLDGFQKYLRPCSFDGNILSIGRVNPWSGLRRLRGA